MGRELRRKQAKKEGKSLQVESLEDKNQIQKFIKITCLLIIITSLIYIISALFITKELQWFGLNKKEQNVNIVANSIVASAIFKQKEEEYYVYFYDFNDTKIDENITNKISNLSKKVYKVDTSSALNSKYISESTNKAAKNLEELQVSSPTLIKIISSEIVGYYEKDEIINVE